MPTSTLTLQTARSRRWVGFLRATRAFVLGAFGTGFVLAGEIKTGAFEGRVLNLDTGEYLERARVTIEDRGVETFTDEQGQFYLANVPAGVVTVKVFFTGLSTQLRKYTNVLFWHYFNESSKLVGRRSAHPQCQDKVLSASL